MENEIAASLADAADTRRRLAERARRPWWYFIGFGVALGLILLGNGLATGILSFSLLFAGIAIELAVMLAYRNRTAVWANCWRTSAPALVVLCVFLAGCLVAGQFLRGAASAHWLVWVIAVVAAIVYTGLAYWADARWRGSIDRGA